MIYHGEETNYQQILLFPNDGEWSERSHHPARRSRVELLRADEFLSVGQKR